MRIRFASRDLERLDADANFTAGLPHAVVAAFRKRMQLIRAATDERDLYQLKSLHFEHLKGRRKGQCSLRLNDQWRLVVTIQRYEEGKVVVIEEVTDYH